MLNNQKPISMGQAAQDKLSLVSEKKGNCFWAFGKHFKLSFKGVLQSSCDEGFFSISLSFFLSRTDDFTFWRQTRGTNSVMRKKKKILFIPGEYCQLSFESLAKSAK